MFSVFCRERNPDRTWRIRLKENPAVEIDAAPARYCPSRPPQDALIRQLHQRKEDHHKNTQGLTELVTGLTVNE